MSCLSCGPQTPLQEGLLPPTHGERGASGVEHQGQMVPHAFLQAQQARCTEAARGAERA